MAVTFLQRSAGNSATTTLSAAVSNTDTSFPLTSDTSFLPGGGLVIIDEGQSAEELAYYTGKTGGALTIPLANRGLEGGSAQGHDLGASVKGVLSADMWNNLIEAVLNGFSATDGTVDTTKLVTATGIQTLTNKTLTSPIISTVSNTGTVTLPTATDTLVGRATTDTLTNKRNEPRIVSAASYTTDTGTSLSVATADEFIVTAQAGALKLNNPGGTPVQGQKLIVRIKDDGTARALTYDTQFRAMGTALPSTTVLSKTLYLGFIYNSTDTKFDLVAVAQES